MEEQENRFLKAELIQGQPDELQQAIQRVKDDLARRLWTHLNLLYSTLSQVLQTPQSLLGRTLLSGRGLKTRRRPAGGIWR